ncbi:gas vesicle accessory protein GvpU [Alkalicoccus daliensis]|uniref:Gas vesicle protein GvpU n=1 Tax=Alkalicoccus daliensis TaxID=745820 RepID=A0A1H0DUM4_9BACI|nr:gas vesicle accessory protein GvpU [Alkalicoccus daliensis]SDN73733.1 hypothetical protein SAMN04488053_10389 [Alkalicoccus daliensis]
MAGSNKEKDVILQLMIESVNEHEDYEIPITLNVHGTLVSGNLVSAEYYFQELMEAFSEDNDADKQIYDKLEKATHHLESGEEPGINYVHMKEAKMFDESGTAIPSKGNVLWRGKMKEVDGFFIGKVKES